MKIMLDSGAAKSLISKAALNRIQHLPVNYHQRHYLLVDSYATFEVIGTVKVFIEFNSIKTSIVAAIVNSLCTDCVLGTDYINKYEVSFNAKDKQIQIHALKTMITVPIENHAGNVKILCRSIKPTSIYQY